MDLVLTRKITFDEVTVLEVGEELSTAHVLPPDLAHDLGQLEAALRNGSGQIDTEKHRSLLAVLEGLAVGGEDLHPRQAELKAKAEELRDTRQVVLIHRLVLEREQRVDVEKELTADELCAIMRGREASQFALEYVLDFLLDDDLLGLVQLKVSECNPSLARVPTRIRSKGSHLV